MAGTAVSTLRYRVLAWTESDGELVEKVNKETPSLELALHEFTGRAVNPRFVRATIEVTKEGDDAATA